LPNEITEHIKEATSKDPFLYKLERVSLAKGFQVYGLGTPEERDKMRLSLAKRLMREVKLHPTKSQTDYAIAERHGFFDKPLPPEAFKDDETPEENAAEPAEEAQ
jgi:hypothetical protein